MAQQNIMEQPFTCRLLTLPAELRERIYRYVLEEPSPWSYIDHREPDPHRAPIRSAARTAAHYLPPN